MKRLLLTLLIALPTFMCQVAIALDYSKSGKYTVKEMQITGFTDTQRAGRPLPIKIHYPAEKGSFPLIIISHGAGGNWDTHFALAHHLASYGYIVFCLEHVGSNTKTLKKSMRLLKNLNEMIHDGSEVLGRPKDVSFAIDVATTLNHSNELLTGKIDLGSIGVLGHSFGAFTTMVVGGMRPAMDWLEPKASYGSGLGPNLKDVRVKACVALSPQGVGEPFFLKESFTSLSAPLLGISGTEDKQQNGLPPINRYQSFDLWNSTGSCYFIWLANAHHLDFSDGGTDDNFGMRSKNRQNVQKVVRAASLLFFNKYLKHDSLAGTQLNTNSLKPYLSGEVDNIEVRNK